ncbi:hypothetical protein [Bradyrhizobium sp. 6(2017)]|uniref:hypothetical protein n=1 Tax=Bradyrhizobium sp. 6(2017) TaxID=1197460 RepID=UPI0013E15AA0|nr:hypothetical protein [Bradyrhizobium sp. 6(2017)]QIG92271.1 hypothetical protein G6P99_06980 [Bradyrhizobium sp. 6(2017)]
MKPVTRRVGLRVLAGAAAASTLTGSVKAADASLAGVVDPIFALIEDHRRLQTLRCELYDEWDRAEMKPEMSTVGALSRLSIGVIITSAGLK